MNKLYIIIPAYNEQDTIEKIMNEWYPVIENSEFGEESRLVIMDDGSKDKTFEIMSEFAKTHPRFVPIKKSNSGHGATVLYGYQYAIEQDADFVFQTDSDGQTLAEEFKQFWDLRNEYDFIIGHRNKREDGIIRIFVTKTLKFVISLCFGVRITDANTPYRLMSTITLKKALEYVPAQFNLSNIIISVFYVSKKYRVKFIPITFRERQGGVNSINFKKIFHIGMQAVKDFWKIRKALRSKETVS